MNYTVFIPTKNRPTFVRKNLNYLSGTQFLGTVIILDSSDVDNANDITQMLSDYPKLNIEYRHLIGLPWQVMKAAMPEVKTDYVSFIGDDDFLLPSAVGQAVSALDADGTYNSAVGDILLAKLNKNMHSVDFFYPYYPAIAKKSTRIERIQELFECYQVSLFAIYRRSAFEEILHHVPSFDEYHKCPVWAISDEIMPSAFGVGVGKTYEINQLMVVRSIHKDRYRMPALSDNPLQYTKAEAYFRQQMKQFVMQEPCDKKSVETAIDDILYRLRYRKIKVQSRFSRFFSMPPQMRLHILKHKLPWMFNKDVLNSDFIKNHDSKVELTQIYDELHTLQQ